MRAEKVAAARTRLAELETALADPTIIADRTRHQQLSREYKRLRGALAQYDELVRVEAAAREAREVVAQSDDPEIARLASEEAAQLEQRQVELEQALWSALLPPDPRLEKNCIVEIRGAAGGDEAALFAGELFRMFEKAVEHRGWKLEVLSARPTGIGGFREIIFSVEGDAPYRFLRLESGVHRVQRVPATEAAGRIHTSTVTVVVLPEAEEVDLRIDPSEIRIDVYRASGHGGQHVNVTDSAVRITHLPTGIMATCQDERSQHRNREKAMKILRARLLAARQAEIAARESADRRRQVGTGERSEKIRTYNFPQNRVTDHRIGTSFHKLAAILDGDLDDVWNALARHEQTSGVSF